MANIADVLDNKAFYAQQCIAQALGDKTCISLYNPVGSGVVASLVKSSHWASKATEFNLMRTNSLTGLGTDRGVRNSKFFPGTAGTIGSSQSKLYALFTGTAPSTNALEVYRTDYQPQQDEFPFTMGPGEALVLIPDTTAQINWCWSLTFVETPLPA